MLKDWVDIVGGEVKVCFDRWSEAGSPVKSEEYRDLVGTVRSEIAGGARLSALLERILFGLECRAEEDDVKVVDNPTDVVFCVRADGTEEVRYFASAALACEFYEECLERGCKYVRTESI